MNANVKNQKNQVKNSGKRNSNRLSEENSERLLELTFLQKEEIRTKMTEIASNMHAYTWKELEVGGKFNRNEKLSFITDDMLVVGCDIGSETHYIRAIDARGVEYSKTAFSFENNEDGYQSALSWMLQIAAENSKTQIIFGLEPTGHYWFSLAVWMIDHGVSVVQVNPYAVKQTKELEDNSQAKNDRKDPKLIADLVKNGNYGMPYLPEEVYADLRVLSMLRDQLTEDRGRCLNRLHRELKIVFPEYKEAFGKIDGLFTLHVLVEAPLPRELKALGEEGIRKIWHEAKLRGAGYRRAKTIVQLAEKSVGITSGAEARKTCIISWVEKLIRLMLEIDEVEAHLAEVCMEIPYAENLLEIDGLGINTVIGIVAQIGDIRRFDDAKELQKLSGLGLVDISSGKHKGQTKISHRGRKRLRYWLFQGALSVVSHDEGFKQIHEYYTTRNENPLKKMQSITAVACKLLRIIFIILTRGDHYDREKMLSDIVRPANQETAA